MRRLLILAVMASACGGAAEEAPPPVIPKSYAPAPPEPARPPPGSLWRHEVTRAVDDGLGYFLQRVTVEPEVASGRFRGFRIVELYPPEWWDGVDLRPGDVVTAVNGMPIERETEAFAAFESLRTARKLEVSYRRGGVQRTLVYSIVEQDGEPKKTAPAEAAPKAKPPAKQKSSNG